MRPFPAKFYDFDRAEKEYGYAFDKQHKPAAPAPEPEDWLNELLSFPIEHRASCAVGVGPGRNCDCGLIEILEKARAYRASLSAKEK